jgi:phosphatidylserine synthase
MFNLLIPIGGFFGAIAAILLADKYWWSSERRLAYFNLRDRQVLSHMDVGFPMAWALANFYKHLTAAKGNEDHKVIEEYRTYKAEQNAQAICNNLPIPYPEPKPTTPFFSSWLR